MEYHLPSIIQLLLDFVNSENLGSIDRKIAEYLLSNVQTISQLSNSDIAEACNVSKATVSRFCKNIGLNDFYQLKSMSHTISIDAFDKFFQLVFQEEDFISHYLDNIELIVKMYRSDLDTAMLEKLIKDIISHKNVYILGTMQCEAVGQSFQSLLMMNGKYVSCISSFKESKETLLNSASEDLFVTFSVSGRYFERLFSKNEYLSKKSRPKIYLITANNDLEKSSYARHVIHVPANDSLSSIVSMDIYASLLGLMYFKFCRE